MQSLSEEVPKSYPNLSAFVKNVGHNSKTHVNMQQFANFYGKSGSSQSKSDRVLRICGYRVLYVNIDKLLYVVLWQTMVLALTFLILFQHKNYKYAYLSHSGNFFYLE